MHHLPFIIFSDFYVYDVDRDMVVELVKETNKIGGPDAGFTQRSTLDVAHQELFLFSGLMREKSGVAFTTTTTSSSNANATNTTSSSGNGQIQAPLESARNSFWLYSLRKHRWTRLYSNEATAVTTADGTDEGEPCPRFAHQLVYDPELRLHYLFGGNPGEAGNPRRRLGDFWRLALHRPRSPSDILRRAIFLLRRQQFYEMCYARRDSTPASPSMVTAMRFLQNEVAQAVDHTDPEESKEFRALSALLLNFAGSEERVRERRLDLFTSLVGLLPKRMQPPSARISDVVQL